MPTAGRVDHSPYCRNYYFRRCPGYCSPVLFDEQADAIYVSIYILAERLTKIGGTTIRSISHISSLQTIKDNNEDLVAPDEMIAQLLADNRHIAENHRKAIRATEDANDRPTSNILQE